MRAYYFFFIFFLLFCVFVLHPYHGPVKTESYRQVLYRIAHTDCSRPNTQPGISPVVPKKHVKTLDRLVGTISDNHVPPECSCTSWKCVLIHIAKHDNALTRHVSASTWLEPTAGYETPA
jgi:hypothetical protein